MNKHIIWTVEGKIKQEEKQEYLDLMDLMLQEVKKEEGTLHYEWTLSEDNRQVHVYERYKNAEEATKHLVTWGKFASRYLNLVEVEKFTVYSELTPELQEAVAGLNPIYMKLIGGFRR